MPPLDQSTLAFIIAAVIYGIAQGINLVSQKKLLPFGGSNGKAAPSSPDRLAQIEQKLDEALAKQPGRLTARGRKLRDRAIYALHEDGWENDDIAAVLSCTERIVKRLIA